MLGRQCFYIPVVLAFCCIFTLGALAMEAPYDRVDANGEPYRTNEITLTHLTNPTAANYRDSGNDLDPGQPPEGDFLAWPVYTNDGQTIIMGNRMTDNVTFFNAATRTVMANVNVGQYPAGIGITDQYAIVACVFSDEVWIIDLATHLVAAVIPTAEQPWVVRVSPDQTRAFIACDIPDVCEIIDLTTLTHVDSINSFPISLVTFSWGSESGRNSVSFTGFEVTPDGAYLVTGDRENAVLFFDSVTGAPAHRITGIPSCTTVGLSGDGSTLVALSSYPTAIAHQIDLASFSLVTSVPVTGYSLSTHQVAVNQDGNKAFMGINSNSSAFANFTTGGFTVLTSTYTPFSIGVSPDHQYALGVQYRFSVLDFASEQLVGQRQGIRSSLSAVSPVGMKAVSIDPVTDESLNFYDYSDATDPQWIGSCVAGLAPEGDAPRRVTISPDGTMAVVTNVVSDNTSLIDLNTGLVTAILPTGDRPQNVEITPDSHWAVVAGMDSHSVFILDLNMGRVVAEIPTGLRPGVVSITPDGTHAYVGNIQGNSISVIELAGAGSSLVTTIPCGVIGVSYAAYGVQSDVQVSPDGAYCLVAASFDDQVQIIDTSSNTIVASLAVGDFPLQIAFENTGDYATVTNWFDDSISVLRIDGAFSSVVTTVSTGDGPLRLAYNAANDQMGIAHYYTNQLQLRDPRTGALISTQSYSGYGSLIQVEFDDNGRPLALTSAASNNDPPHFHEAELNHELPAGPSYFAAHKASGFAAVVMPGPDHVMVYGDNLTASPMHIGLEAGPGFLMQPGPNPGNGNAQIAFRLRESTDAVVTVYDLAGRRLVQLRHEHFPEGLNRLQWDGRDEHGRMLATGAYLVELRVGTWSMTRKVTRMR